MLTSQRLQGIPTRPAAQVPGRPPRRLWRPFSSSTTLHSAERSPKPSSPGSAKERHTCRPRPKRREMQSAVHLWPGPGLHRLLRSRVIPRLEQREQLVLSSRISKKPDPHRSFRAALLRLHLRTSEEASAPEEKGTACGARPPKQPQVCTRCLHVTRPDAEIAAQRAVHAIGTSLAVQSLRDAQPIPGEATFNAGAAGHCFHTVSWHRKGYLLQSIRWCQTHEAGTDMRDIDSMIAARLGYCPHTAIHGVWTMPGLSARLASTSRLGRCNRS